MTSLTIKTDSPETVVLLMEILMEVARAEQKHPIWPECHIKQIAIVMEEAGELVRAGNQIDEGKGTFQDVRTEAIQTAATSIRFLKRLAETDNSYNQAGIIEYFSESEVNNG